MMYNLETYHTLDEAMKNLIIEMNNLRPDFMVVPIGASVADWSVSIIKGFLDGRDDEWFISEANRYISQMETGLNWWKERANVRVQFSDFEEEDNQTE